MIVFEDILGMLAAKGFTTYRIRREKLISEGTVARIRTGQSISTNTIDRLCELLDCQPQDLMRYVPGKKQG